MAVVTGVSLQLRHNGHDGVLNHQPHHCLLNPLFRRRSKKTSRLHITGLCAGNSPVTGEFPTQMASNAENVSIWWHHHEYFTWETLNILWIIVIDTIWGWNIKFLQVIWLWKRWVLFTPQPLRAPGYCRRPSGRSGSRAGGRADKPR